MWGGPLTGAPGNVSPRMRATEWVPCFAETSAVLAKRYELHLVSSLAYRVIPKPDTLEKKGGGFWEVF